MSIIDIEYLRLVNKIVKTGFTYNDPNRKGVKRIQIPYHTLIHDFDWGFPIIGLKQSFPKSAFNEMKVFMSGVNTLKGLEDLGVSFWRKDAYNHYLKQFLYDDAKTMAMSFDNFMELSTNDSKFLKSIVESSKYKLGDLGKIYPYQIRSWEGNFDQLNSVLERLKREPNSTKNIVTMWNPNDLEESALSPCHTRFSFVVENLKPKPIVFDEIEQMPADIVFRENKYKYGLRIQWNQDSVDTFLGLPMNILYYSFACYVFAHYLGMKPLGIIGNLTNVHLYDNSLGAVEELLKRNANDTPRADISTKFPTEYESLDDYIEQLDFKNNIYISNYAHLGKLNVEMLEYRK